MNKEKKKGGCLKWIGIIVVICILAGVFASCGSSGDGSSSSGDNTESNSATSTTSTQETQEKKEKPLTSYSDGMYKVGDDLKAREYILVPSGQAYYEVSSDSSGNLDSIVSNDNFSGTRYITLKDGQYIKLQSCTAYPAKYVKKGKISNDDLSNGMYKVGVDIDAGEYQVEADGDNGYLEVDSNSNGSMDSIVTNENFSSTVYVSVEDGQYLKLSGAKIVEK